MKGKKSGFIKKYSDVLPVVAAVGIIPLIVRLGFHTNEDFMSYPWFVKDYGETVDVFLACKAAAIGVLAVLMVIILADRIVIRREKPAMSREFCLLLVYLLLSVVSGLTSGHRALAFKGSFERFEPVYVIAGYLIIFYYSYSCIKSKEDLRALIKITSVFIFIMLALGILQSVGLDPFGLDLVKRLITPASMHDDIGNIQIVRDKGVAYLTLYNENYLGMYFGLLIPVFISLIFAFKSKGAKAAAGVTTLAALYVLWHGRSSNGWMALAITGVIAAVILAMRKFGMKRTLIVTGALAGLLLLALILLPPVKNRAKDFFYAPSDGVRKVTDIKTEDDEVLFVLFDGSELHGRFDFADDGSFIPEFTDKDGNELIYRIEDGACVLDECFAYADAAVHVEDIGGYRAAVFVIDEHFWPVVKDYNRSYCYLNYALNPVKVTPVKRAGIFSDGFFSGRGVIWDKCLPLLVRHIILGSGANTFAFEFPQEDYVRLNYTYGWGGCNYDVKAHSLYLGNMIENGVIGTLCLIIFLVIYIIRGVRFYAGSDGGKDDKIDRWSFVYIVGFGIFLGCIAYMISGLVNDSNVCTAPAFWAMLGISGMSLHSD